ncbi:hypothetical protein SH501x_005244 [Pirellulaceae bacterium SH501]
MRDGIQSVVQSIRNATQERRDFLRTLKKETASLLAKSSKIRQRQASQMGEQLDQFKRELSRFVATSKRRSAQMVKGFQTERLAGSACDRRKRKSEIGALQRSVKRTLTDAKFQRRKIRSDVQFATQETLRHVKRRVMRLKTESRSMLQSLRNDRAISKRIWAGRA